MSPERLNELSELIYKQNCQVGWWDDPNRCLVSCCQLIITEIAEASEGYRKDIMDDHLPHRKMEEVELADAMIRTLDLGGRLGIQYRQFMFYWPRLKGLNAHFLICSKIISFGQFLPAFDDWPCRPKELYCELVYLIMEYSKQCGYDLEGAMLEKIEYNRHRADHKRENRAKDGGKKL